VKKKTESLVLGKILQKIAPKIGATVLIEPEWEIAGQITFKNGKRSYFRYNTLDLNPQGSSEIARDKDYANFFMGKLGYPIVPESKAFFSKAWGQAIGKPEQNIDTAYKYAKQIGFPVIIKPNSGVQGICVSLVQNKAEFYQATAEVFKQDRIVLVQKQVIGQDFRLVVLNEEVIATYERTPLCVAGDGKLSIAKLLSQKQAEFAQIERRVKIEAIMPQIILKLKHQGLNLQSILAKNQQVFLLDNANLSTGGDMRDASDEVHTDFKNLAINLTKDMGLRLCGVDLIVNGDISKPTDEALDFWVLEVNASPGLDHYTKLGGLQMKKAEELYLKILKHLAR